MQCPLCASDKVVDYHQDKKRPYLQCQLCDLVFVPSKYQLSSEDEKSEYDKHENQVDDPGYLNFLSRMANPVNDRVKNNSSGIDIGSGPAPALANLLEHYGHQMAVYDLYYFDDKSVLDKTYDFVTCTEVIEHIAQPNKFISHLLTLIGADGLLGIMTKLVINPERFATWHYKNDPTHICFYSQKTIRFIGRIFNLDIEFLGNDVVLLTPQKITQ